MSRPDPSFLLYPTVGSIIRINLYPPHSTAKFETILVVNSGFITQRIFPKIICKPGMVPKKKKKGSPALSKAEKV